MINASKSKTKGFMMQNSSTKLIRQVTGDPNDIFVFANQEEMQELRDKGLFHQQRHYTRDVVYRSIKFIN
jgi:ABC-type molybdate transport system substrate-binding protein